MAYDDLSRVNSIISYDSKDKMIFKEKYSYDTVGNIIRKERSAKESIHYQYDNKYQLTGVEFQLGGKLNYAFDTMGNRTNFKYSFGEKKYEYDEMNKLKKIWSKPKGITTFDYDIEGNVVKETKFHKNKTQIIAEKQYMFNLYNQLTEINIPQKNDQNLINIKGTIQGDKKVKFQYSGDGVRIEKEYIVEGVEIKTNLTIFHYNFAGNLILETDKQGTAKNAYIYGNGMLICRYNYQELLPDNQELFYHFENTGSIVRITDKSGKQVQKYEYDPYGNIIEAEGVIHDNPFRYSQKYYDIETGLYYYGARYYNPEYGRWLSEDPITANIFNWRDNNPYQFCYNNPNIFTDVWGMIVRESATYWGTGAAAEIGIDTFLFEVVESTGEDVGSKALSATGKYIEEKAAQWLKNEAPKAIIKQTTLDIAENTLFDFIKKQALMTGLKKAGKGLAKNTLSGLSQSGDIAKSGQGQGQTQPWMIPEDPGLQTDWVVTGALGVVGVVVVKVGVAVYGAAKSASYLAVAKLAPVGAAIANSKFVKGTSGWYHKQVLPNLAAIYIKSLEVYTSFFPPATPTQKTINTMIKPTIKIIQRK